MKIADVKIGETYLTKVSGALVKVIAVARVEPDGHWNKQARFCVRRADNNKTLDKTRTASALRPLPAADPIAAALIAGAKEARALEREGRWTDAADAWDRVKTMAAENHRLRMVNLALASISVVRAKIAETAK